MAGFIVSTCFYVRCQQIHLDSMKRPLYKIGYDPPTAIGIRGHHHDLGYGQEDRPEQANVPSALARLPESGARGGTGYLCWNRLATWHNLCCHQWPTQKGAEACTELIGAPDSPLASCVP